MDDDIDHYEPVEAEKLPANLPPEVKLQTESRKLTKFTYVKFVFSFRLSLTIKTSFN